MKDRALLQASAALELGWRDIAEIFLSLAERIHIDQTQTRPYQNPNSKGHEHETLRCFSLKVRQ